MINEKSYCIEWSCRRNHSGVSTTVLMRPVTFQKLTYFYFLRGIGTEIVRDLCTWHDMAKRSIPGFVTINNSKLSNETISLVISIVSWREQWRHYLVQVNVRNRCKIIPYFHPKTFAWISTNFEPSKHWRDQIRARVLSI